ncbi:hypothetical protein V7111_22485 [Neobacillus niacini]|uniref:hypothetical protein n=1 Tax=Neobacillus niacini TaxID=86668 RepID=UPI0030015C1C
MNFCASGTFLLAFSYASKKLILPIAGGLDAIARALVMIPLNMIIVPFEFGMSFEKVWVLMLPVYIPFNLIKGALNTAIFIAVWSLLTKRVPIRYPNLIE